jgi:hypothetical protein
MLQFLTAATAALTLAAPVTTGHSGWEPAPTPPFDRAAGVVCDVAIHAEPTIDETVRKTLTSYPDGTVKSEAYTGRLVIRVTNTGTGTYYDADVSGSAVVTHAPDGAQTWYAVGPVLLGVPAGRGNLPRGLYVVDGVYRLQISPTGYKTVTLLHGSELNVCDRL